MFLWTPMLVCPKAQRYLGESKAGSAAFQAQEGGLVRFICQNEGCRIVAATETKGWSIEWHAERTFK